MKAKTPKKLVDRFDETFLTDVWRNACKEDGAHGCSVNVHDVWIALAVKHFGLKVPMHLIHPVQLVETNEHLFVSGSKLSTATKLILDDIDVVDTIFEGPFTSIIKFRLVID